MMTSPVCSRRRAAYLRTVLAALLAALACTAATSQTSTGAQQLAFAGLRSVANQGQFNAIKADASGNLFLLLYQNDGVRILKTDPTATNLLAQSHLGATGDIGVGLALDPSGNVYVAGTTTSTTLTGTAGAAFPTRADTSTNSFIAKYDPNLNNLFVTFAGSGHLAATSVAATADAVFLTGSLFAATLPVTANALQLTPAQGSSNNGFVERFSANGSTLVYATYLTGANGDTSPAALAADSTDSAYIAGYTTATGFPTLAALVPIIEAAAANTTPSSGFLTKVTPAGDAITFSTFIPGSGVSSLALDTTQNNLLLSGTIDFSAFPVANVQSPLVATQYQSALRIALNGSSVINSTLLAPGTQSSVIPSTNGTAWADGNLTTPLLPLTPVASTGSAFAARIASSGLIDQTARFGGLASTNAANASAPVNLTSLATGLTGQPFFAGAFTPTASSSLLATQRYDLSLANASTAILPSAVTDAALPAGSCSGSLCAGSAAYLAKLSTTGATTASLAFSIGASPDILLRNLSTTAATNLQLSATTFTQTNTCPTTLAAGAECSIALSGTGPGTLTAQADNAITQTVSLPATTTTSTPLVFSPRELDFGIQTATSAPILRTITVTNLSTTTQTFTSAADILVTKNTPASPFTESSSDCATTTDATIKTLPAGATCHITLAFALTSSITDGPITALWKIAVSGSHDVTLTAYANAAAYSVSTAHIDFGTQYTGGLRTPRYLYLSNNSDTAIAHAAITAASPFTATDNCPTTLAAHSVCQIQFTYASPVSPSNDATTIPLDQNLSVLVSGNTLPSPGGGSSTVNPSLTVSPTSVTFANSVPVTSVSTTTQTVTITNTGAASFLLSLALTGDFTQATSCSAALPANSSCTVVLTFAPTAPGTRTGLLAVTAGSSTPVYVNLTGTATAILPNNNGTLTFAATDLAQPTTQWLKVSQPFQSLTATATGPFAVLLVEDIGYGHGTPAPASFKATTTGTCLNCYLGVQYTPTATGPQTGTLTLTSATNTNAYTLALTGSGLATTGLIVTPATQDFATVPVNSTSQPFLFSLTNLLTANATITLTTPTVTGDFALSQAPTGGSPCTGSLAPAATCFVQITFSPTATGPRTGTLTFPTSGGNATAAFTGTATADPGLALSPNALTFQNVPGVTATQQTITLTNTGNASLQIATPTTTSTAFTATTTCNTLAPTATCTVTVTYTPTTAPTSATFQIPVTSASAQSTYTISLTGAYTSANAALQILPAQVNFGPTTVDTIGLTRTFTLNNLTAQPLTPTLTLPHAFALTAPNPCPALAANASCNFNITTLPLTTSDTTGTIYAQAAAYNSVAYLETFGANTAASALTISGPLSPGTGVLDFGQVTSGQSLSQTLTLTNTATSAQTVTLRRVTAQPPFLSTTTCGATLTPSQACTVTITYTPLNQVLTGSAASAPIQNTGTLTFESDDAASPNVINLTGSAAPTAVASPSNVSPIATYTLSQSSFTFPNTGVGNVSSTQTVTLTNTGTATLHLGTLRITPDFTLTNNCPTAIVPAATCTLTLAFTPTATGIRTGTAQISSDSGTSLDFLTLFGLSFPSSLLLSPQSLSFGTLLVGASATQPVTLTNNGQVPVALSSITATGDYTPTSNCPVSLAASAICTVQVAFTPTAAGTRTGTLSVTNSATTLPLLTSLTGSGIQSHLALSPTTLAFGNVGVGSSLNLSLLLTNSGTASITALALAITGDYTIASPCPTATLAPAQTCTVTITFTPAITGSRPGTLTITSSDPSSPTTVPLTGTGIQSHLQIAPTTLIFGSIAIGSSATQTITLTNNGTAPITSLAPAITGDYAITTPCGTTTLTPAQTCTLNITFTPTGSGTRTGSLTLTSSDPTSPATVPLTGTGTQSRLQITPATLNFGSVPLASSSTQTLTLTNSGTAPITGLTTFITSGDFAVTTLCSSATLTPGQTCTLTVTFTPTATGSRSGTLTLASSDPASPTTVPLNGTGTQSHLQITPATLNFGTVTVASSASLALTVANTGTAPISSLAFTLTGDYAITSPCPLTTLTPTQSCTVIVTFTPTATGSRPGTLAATSTDSTSPTSIPLTGTGTAATVPVTPGSFTLTVNGGATATATVPSGSTATYNLTLTPVNGFTGPVVFNCTPLTTATYSSCAMLPSTLTLAGAPQYATLTINTLTSLDGTHASAKTPTPTPSLARTLLCLLAPGCFLFLRRTRRRTLPLLFLWTALCAFALSTTGCGGSGPNPNLLYVNPGTYQYQVTASSTATVPITQSVNVTVVVTN